MEQEMIMKALAGALAPALQEVMKHTTPTGTPSTPYVHGPGGCSACLGWSGRSSTPVYSRSVWPVNSRFGQISQFPLYPYISGFRDVSGDVADGVRFVLGPPLNCAQETYPKARTINCAFE